MKRKFFGTLCSVGICLAAPLVMQGSVVVTFGGTGLSCFNSATSAGCSGTDDNIWNTDDFISETFSGTGLGSVDQLSLSLSLFDGLASGITESWSIDLNGTQVGTLSETGPGVSSYAQTFDFASIAGPDYTILFTVLSPGVGGGNGTLGLLTGIDGTSTATLSGSSTPEPSSLLLCLVGSVGIGMAMVRRQKAMKLKA